MCIRDRLCTDEVISEGNHQFLRKEVRRERRRIADVFYVIIDFTLSHVPVFVAAPAGGKHNYSQKKWNKREGAFLHAAQFGCKSSKIYKIS
jgi:uncharacterized protein (UPF0303 family)